MDLTGIAKSIDPSQPVQSDHGQNSLLLADFLCINSLPNDNILDCTKLKAFADVKLNDAKMMISLFYRVENIVGKGENAGHQHFLLFPQCFPKCSFLGVVKSRGCVVKR